MKIGKFDTEKKVFIVAEVGNNHEGSYEAAAEMVKLAAAAGADAVKFQTFVPEKYVASSETKRLEQLKKFQLTYAQFEKLHAVANKEGICFLSTPFDIDSAEFLNPLVPAFKISSGDNTFHPLLEAVAKTGKPIILSTGLTGPDEIAQAMNTIERTWREHGRKGELALLHCVVAYPTPAECANLLAIQTLKRFGVTVGYSDHTAPIDASVAAVAVGARLIEKHFTADKNRSSFRDHQLSADPAEFKRMVTSIREVEKLLGDGVKRVLDVEKANGPLVRRSISAKRNLAPGHVLAMEDLTWLRPGAGLPPGSEQKLLGQRINRAIQQGEPIHLEDIVACAA